MWSRCKKLVPLIDLTSASKVSSATARPSVAHSSGCASANSFVRTLATKVLLLIPCLPHSNKRASTVGCRPVRTHISITSTRSARTDHTTPSSEPAPPTPGRSRKSTMGTLRGSRGCGAPQINSQTSKRPRSRVRSVSRAQYTDERTESVPLKPRRRIARLKVGALSEKRMP